MPSVHRECPGSHGFPRPCHCLGGGWDALVYNCTSMQFYLLSFSPEGTCAPHRYLHPPSLAQLLFPQGTGSGSHSLSSARHQVCLHTLFTVGSESQVPSTAIVPRLNLRILDRHSLYSVFGPVGWNGALHGLLSLKTPLQVKEPQLHPLGPTVLNKMLNKDVSILCWSQSQADSGWPPIPGHQPLTLGI